MGGVNHQPTRNMSLVHTVPAAQALTRAVAKLMEGNCAIESVVMQTDTTNFGVGRTHLIEARDSFRSASTQLGIVRSHIARVTDTLGNPEYLPFDLSSIDVDGLVATLIADGRLTDSAATSNALEIVKSQGYQGIFFTITDLIDAAKPKIDALVAETEVHIDGPAGMQGYFWELVEANRTTWRTDYMGAQTALLTLLQFWTATAAICTEVHLQGAHGTSLFNNLTVTV